MRNALEKIGFFRIEESIPLLTSQAERMVEKAGTSEDCEKFEALPSFIDPAPPGKQHEAVLAIDIGGTHSRLGLRTLEGGHARWVELINVFNDELNSGLKKLPGLQRFASEMAVRACTRLRKDGIDPAGVTGLGIVWSNALENRVEHGSIKGVVTQREHYKKNEWFISDLGNGTEINAPFEEAFRSAGAGIRLSLVGNDTPLTFKAAESADSGAVVSTGMNGTIVKAFRESPGSALRKVVCNAEMGGRMVVPIALRSKADLLDEERPAQYIESLSAGKSLPQLFNNYIIQLARAGFREFDQLASILMPVSGFKAADLCNLLYGPDKFVSTFRAPDFLRPVVLRALTELSTFLLTRAARISAIMAYATICNQLADKNHFRIALESRLCREIPLYLETMTSQLGVLMPSGKSAELVLLEPLRPDGGSISVPMQGAASALDNLFTEH